jgi:competence protein ComEC
VIGLLDRHEPHVLVLAACLGLAAANAVRPPVAASAVAAALLAAAAFGTAVYRRLLLALALLAIGWAWSAHRLAALDASELLPSVGETAHAYVVVTAPPRRGTYDLRVFGTVVAFGGRRLDEPVLLRLPLGRSPPQGAILRTIATVELPRHGDGDFDESAWLRRQGIQVVVRGRVWRIAGRRAGIGGVADRLRAHLLRSSAPGLGGERRAVIVGVVLGEDEGLSEPLRDDFRAAGLYHLLAVSGQNVAYVALGVFALAWLLRVPRVATEVAVIGAIGGYVLAVGWQPSVVRAGVAGALASLAWLAARPRDRWYFLLVGAAVLLAWNPYSLLDPGFQLSFAAVGAIFVLVPRLERRLEGYPLPRRLAEVVAIAAACGAATAPILWVHFDSVPLFTVLSNAAAAPAMPALLGLALVDSALDPVLPGAAAALAWANGWLAAYVAACARLVAGLPFATLESPLAAGLLVAACIAAWGAPRLSPWMRRRVFVVVLASAGPLVVWQLWPVSRPPPEGLRITFLDVGQGDAALIEVREGALLVDQGPPQANVAEQLSRLGVRRLALLVLTHPQRDHIGGAEAVIRRLRVDAVLDPQIPAPNEEYAATVEAARSRRTRVVPARAGTVYRLGSLLIRILWPRDGGPPGEDPNRHSVVLLASYGRVDALFTADAESDVVVPLRPPAVEILKVAHHGSRDDRLGDLLERTRPRVAVISVGARNDYGHPAPSTVAALEDARALTVLRTDRDGRVVVESDGARLRIREER